MRRDPSSGKQCLVRILKTAVQRVGRAGRALAAALALLFAAPLARADLTVSGYLKDFNVWSKTLIDPQDVTENTGRARLQFDWRQSGWGTFVAYDQEYLSGSLLKSKEVQLFGVSPPASFLNMDWTLDQSSGEIWRHRFYRAYVESVSSPWTVRVGRQRINWGTGKIWQPTDVLNPYQPLSLEQDERRGVDSVYMRRAMGTFDQLELVYAPLNGWQDTSLLGRVHQYYDLADLDVSLMGGKTVGGGGNTILGGDFSGSMGRGLGYGEWSYTHGTTVYWRYLMGFIMEIDEAPFDWMRSAKIITEFYHNGNGATDPLHYDFAAVLSGRDPWPVRNAAGFVVSKNVHPLVKFDATFLWDLDGAQTYLGASFTWDALKDFQITPGVQTVGGGTLSELGLTRNVYYVMGQYFFGSRSR